MLFQRLLPFMAGIWVLAFSSVSLAHPLDDDLRACLALSQGRQVFNQCFLTEIDSEQKTTRAVTVPVTSYEDLLMLFRMPAHRQMVVRDIQVHSEVRQVLQTALLEKKNLEKQKYVDTIYFSLVLRSDFNDNAAQIMALQERDPFASTLSESAAFFSLAQMLRPHLSPVGKALYRNVMNDTDPRTGKVGRIIRLSHEKEQLAKNRKKRAAEKYQALMNEIPKACALGITTDRDFLEKVRTLAQNFKKYLGPEQSAKHGCELIGMRYTSSTGTILEKHRIFQTYLNANRIYFQEVDKFILGMTAISREIQDALNYLKNFGKTADSSELKAKDRTTTVSATALRSKDNPTKTTGADSEYTVVGSSTTHGGPPEVRELDAAVALKHTVVDSSTTHGGPPEVREPDAAVASKHTAVDSLTTHGGPPEVREPDAAVASSKVKHTKLEKKEVELELLKYFARKIKKNASHLTFNKEFSTLKTVLKPFNLTVTEKKGSPLVQVQFTSPVNNEPIIIFFHAAHGAQKRKKYPGWLMNWRRAFERAQLY